MKKTTKKSIKKVAKKVTPQEEYRVTAKILGQEYVATGPTLKEAVGNLEARNVKGKCIMTVYKGETSKERVLMPALVFRLFNTSGLCKDITVKNISLLFGL